MSSLRPASFRRRLAAGAIDLGLQCGLCFATVALDINGTAGGRIRTYVMLGPPDLLLGVMLVMFIVDMATAFTPGKILLQLRVRNANGELALVRQHFFRAVYMKSPVLLTVGIVAVVHPFNPDSVGTLTIVLGIALSTLVWASFLNAFSSGEVVYDRVLKTSVFQLPEKPRIENRGFEPIINKPPHCG